MPSGWIFLSLLRDVQLGSCAGEVGPQVHAVGCVPPLAVADRRSYVATACTTTAGPSNGGFRSTRATSGLQMMQKAVTRGLSKALLDELDYYYANDKPAAAFASSPTRDSDLLAGAAERVDHMEGPDEPEAVAVQASFAPVATDSVSSILHSDGVEPPSDATTDTVSSILHSDGVEPPSDATTDNVSSIPHSDGVEPPSDATTDTVSSIPHSDGVEPPSDATTDTASSILHSDGVEPPSDAKPRLGLMQHGVKLSLGLCVRLLGRARCRDVEKRLEEASAQGTGSNLAQLVVLLVVLIAVALAFLAFVGRQDFAFRNNGQQSSFPTSVHARQLVPGSSSGAGCMQNDIQLRPPSYHETPLHSNVRLGSLGSDYPLSVLDSGIPSPASVPAQQDGDSLEKGISDTVDYSLCPDLVVPPERECTVAVPVAAALHGVFNVVDTHGSLMFQVASGRSPGAAGGSDYPDMREFALMLDSTTVLARCYAELTGVAFSVSKPSGIRFARIAFHNNGDFPGNTDGAAVHCLLTTRGGMQLYISGDPVHYAMRVRDAAGTMVADTGLCSMEFASYPGQYYRLRVAAMHDVGLVLCSLFAARVMLTNFGA